MNLRLLARVAPWLAAAALPAAATLRSESASDEMLRASLRFSDDHWDERIGLLAFPEAARPPFHPVRESAWYALGLLVRGQPGDAGRAERILDRVLREQFEAPGRIWDGTFRRRLEEATPQPGAVPWNEFDPNWRQFIGTSLALTLLQFEATLPPSLSARMVEAIRRAVEGERGEGRLTPHYTNIALMHAFMLAYAGQRLQRPDWAAQADDWARQIHALYAPHATFEEYNSPTYYGVDLYGLALWRRYGPNPLFRSFGAEMEAGLWEDIARFYHAGLANLDGPFDRAYGMDMRRYVSLVGVWMSLAVGPALAPLPDPTRPMDHELDFICLPTYVALGARIPDPALAAIRGFTGPRQFERRIDAHRTATAWLGSDLMIGGERTGLTRAARGAFAQFHPATMYWRAPGGGIGWMLLRDCPAVDAQAGPHRLSIATVRGDSFFTLMAPGLDPKALRRGHWPLPGLDVRVETDAQAFEVGQRDGAVELTYRGATRFELRPARPQ